MKTPKAARFNLKTLCLATLACYAPYTMANPAGATVVSGSASFQQQGNGLIVTNTPGAIINWNTFSIGKDELTRFVQQNSQSSVLNRVTGQDPSQILGQLQSNGRVFLINPNGIVFGQGAQIDTAGLAASTLDIRDADFQSGRLRFAGAGTGSIQNAAHISTPTGGFVYLIAPQLENNGVIVSPKGEILLAAGSSVELVDGVDTSLRVKLTTPAGEVLNVGQLIAEQGRIGIFATAIRQQGMISANRAERGAGGQIVLKASGDITLGASSVTRSQGGSVHVDSSEGASRLDGRIDVSNPDGKGGDVALLGQRVGLFGQADIDASGMTGGGTVRIGGDYQGKNPAVHNARQTILADGASVAANALGDGAGGRVIVWSDQTTYARGSIDAKGGNQGGDGGFVEVSGKAQLDFNTRVDTTARAGKLGTLLLDPTDLDVISCGSSCGFTSPIISFGDLPSAGSSTILGATLSNATTNVSLQATNSINFYDAVSIAAAGKSLTAEAGNAINVYNTIYAPATVTLKAPSIYVSANVDAGSKVHLLADGLTISGGCGPLVSAPSIEVEPYSSGFGLDIGGCGAGSTLTISTGSLAGIDGNANLTLLGSDIALNATLSRAGDTVMVASNIFTNSAANISTGGRYLVYAADPTTSVRGVSSGFSKHYNQSYTGSTPAYASSGNWFFYSYAPTLYVVPTGGTVTYGSAVPNGYSIDTAYLIDGDNLAAAGISGTASIQIQTGQVIAGLQAQASVRSGLTGSGNAAVGSYSLVYAGGLASSLGYQFASSSGSLVINPATVSLSGKVANKVYDGTTAAKLDVTALTGVLAGDSVQLGGQASFADKNVGVGKAVSLSGITLTGNDAGNYILANTSGSAIADITPALLTLSALTVANKVYDGNTQATLTSYGTLNGVVANEVVQLAGGKAQFADKNAGVGKTVMVSGLTLLGADAGNYLLASSEYSAVADISRAASTTWIGGAGGNWSDPKNWANGVVPDLANVASVSLAAGESVTFDGGAGSVQLDNFSSAGRLVMAGGQLAVGNTLSTADLQQSAGVIQAGNLTVSRSFSQTGGSISQLGSGSVSITQSAGELVLGEVHATNLTLSAQGLISQTQPLVVSGTTKLGAGAINLNMAGNDFTVLTGNSSSNIQLRDDAGDLALAQLVASGSANLTVAGKLSGQGSGPHLQANSAGLIAGSIGSLNLAVDQLTLQTGGSADVVNQRPLQLLAAQTGSDLRIETFGGLTTAGPVVAGGLATLLTHSPLVIGKAGVQAAAITLTSFASTGGNDNVTINGDLVATSGGCAVQSGGSIFQNANIRTNGGAIDMAALGGDLIMAPGVSSVSNGGAINYVASGSMTLGLLDAGAGSVTLSSRQGNINPANPTDVNIVGRTLDATAGGAITLQTSTPGDAIRFSSGSGIAIIRDGAGQLLPGSTSAGVMNLPGANSVVVNAINHTVNTGNNDQQQTGNADATKAGKNPAATQEQDNDKPKKAKKC